MRLIAESLGGARGGEPIFTNVDFSLGAGAALVVTGPNGAGKSTLLRIVAGLLQPAEGAVRLTGGGGDYPTHAAACHYLGHRHGMKTALTVTENLAFWRDFLGSASLDIAAALDRVGLGAIGHLPFGYLSAGQKRRAAIARLLVVHRPIWLLDEPTAGLDRLSDMRFAEVMQAHLSGGGIIVAATHQPLGLEKAEELRMDRDG